LLKNIVVCFEDLISIFNNDFLMRNIDLGITRIYFVKYCILSIHLPGKLRNKKAEVNEQKFAASKCPYFSKKPFC